jgi:hypothetical protein
MIGNRPETPADSAVLVRSSFGITAIFFTSAIGTIEIHNEDSAARLSMVS